MTNGDGTTSAGENLAKKELIENCRWLHQKAWERCESRKEIEWKLCFGIWTAFALMTGFVATQPLSLRLFHAIIASMLALCACVVYIFFWIPWLQRAFKHDARVAYWWASIVEEESLNPDPDPENVSKLLLPKRLLAPGHEKYWRRYRGSESYANAKWEDELDVQTRWDLIRGHDNAIASSLITLAFVLLFILALLYRSTSPSTPSTDEPFAAFKVRDSSTINVAPQDSTKGAAKSTAGSPP